MEVTTVSPSPTSPTEGADLCETDVSSVAMHSVTLLVGLCGLAGNGAVLWLIGLKNISLLIFDLAVSDFLFLLFTVPSALLFLVEDVSCSPILSQVYISVLFQLSMVSCYWGVLPLTHSSRKNCMSTLWQLCCRSDLPERLWWGVRRTQYWAFFALFTLIPTVMFLCPSQEQEHCRAALISMHTIILLLFAAPVVISHSIDFIKGKCGSQQQQIKRCDIIVFLIVLFTLLLSLCNFLQQLRYTVLSSQVLFLLTCINSSIKPFAYFLAGRCWRPCSVRSLQLSLQRVFEEQKDKTSCIKTTTRDTGV